MADEETKDTPQDEPEAEAPAEPEAETPAESEAEAPAEPEAEAPAEPEESADADTPEADAAVATAEAAASGDGEEGPPSPKQLRKRERSRFDGEARPQRSGAERVSERDEARRSKAQARSRWRRARRDKKRSGAAGAPSATPPAPIARSRGERKVRQGVVVSSKADKTITVRIDLVRAHRVYGKVVRNSGTLHAHDERNQANEGDVVRVVECRPLSRTKRWRLLEVLEKAR
jgi:small subunit ribosomal protein S17